MKLLLFGVLAFVTHTSGTSLNGALALRGGGASLPQSVLALSGSALSLSGIAALVEYATRPPMFALHICQVPRRAYSALTP